MSLVTPLVKPLSDSLVKPSVNNDAAIYFARKAIVEKWPFKNSLIGVNSTPATYTRASAEIYENVFGQYQKYTTDAAAYGVGITQHPAITNANTNYNLNPTDTTNITDSNATTTVIAPSEYPAKLQKLADDGDANGNVYRTEASAAAGSAFVVGNPANTNPRSLFVLARAVVGSGKLGLGAAGAPVASVNITSSEWQIYKIDGATPSASGNPLRIICDADGDIIEWIANQTTETPTAPKQLIECAGTSGTLAQTDTQLPTTGFPVNDCSYFFFLPRGIVDNGTNQVIFDCRADASNFTQLYVNSASSKIVVRRKSTSSDYYTNVDYTLDGTPIYGLVVNSSTNGCSIYLSNGNSTTNANIADFELGSSIQFSAVTSTLALPIDGEQAQFGVFNEIVTLEGARRA